MDRPGLRCTRPKKLPFSVDSSQWRDRQLLSVLGIRDAVHIPRQTIYSKPTPRFHIGDIPHSKRGDRKKARARWWGRVPWSAVFWPCHSHPFMSSQQLCYLHRTKPTQVTAQIRKVITRSHPLQRSNRQWTAADILFFFFFKDVTTSRFLMAQQMAPHPSTDGLD